MRIRYYIDIVEVSKVFFNFNNGIGRGGADPKAVKRLLINVINGRLRETSSV